MNDDDLMARTAQGDDEAFRLLVERWEDPTTRQHLARLAVLELGLQDDAAEQFLGTLRTLALEQRRIEREKLLAKSRATALTEEEKQRLRELYQTPAAK